MSRTETIFILCVVYISCASASVYTKGKCSINDAICQKGLVEKIIQEATATGFPDLDIPVIDPYVAKKLRFSVMEMILIDGRDMSITGIRDCTLSKNSIDMDKMVFVGTYSCNNISVTGSYAVSPSPILKTLIGSVKVHGEGTGSVTIEDVEISLAIPFLLKKQSDGDLRIEIQGKDISAEHKILGKCYLALDNLYIGSQEVSTVAAKIINENWEFFAKVTAEQILRTAVEIIAEIANKFLGAVPASDLITDDLSSYATIET